MKKHEEIECLSDTLRKNEEKRRISVAEFDEETWSVEKGVMLLIMGDLTYKYEDVKTFAIYMGGIAAKIIKQKEIKSIVDMIVYDMNIKNTETALDRMKKKFISLYNIFYKKFGHANVTPYDFISYAITRYSVSVPIIMIDYIKHIEKSTPTEGNIFGLAKTVVDMRAKGKTEPEIANVLKEKGLSLSIIGALLYEGGLNKEGRFESPKQCSDFYQKKALALLKEGCGEKA